MIVTTKNKTLNELQKKKREILTTNFEELMDSKRIDNSAEVIFLDQFLKEENRMIQEKMLDALYEKNKRWYRAITMTYYLDLPQTKVAEEMGMNMNAFYVLMNRAKSWIRKYYDEMNENIM